MISSLNSDLSMSHFFQIVYKFKYISWYCSTLQYICITAQKHHKTQI
ncbi:hypothetical protein CLK_1624 [Clostridium botulinum A3 str. Loch Maree]|nr:hypothetical protein CLK_1624 [Clostridium botulinum A3 str. Loch Maree]